MKIKIICFLFFCSGFVGHKVINEIYDYQWWKYSKHCDDHASNIEPYIPNGIKVRDACFGYNLGVVRFIPYLLMRPMIGKNKYFFKQNGWSF